MSKRERLSYDKVVVILVSVYDPDVMCVMQTNRELLDDSDIALLYHSTPAQRAQHEKLRGCNGDEDEDIWKVFAIDDISRFTEEFHCKVIIAYMNE